MIRSPATTLLMLTLCLAAGPAVAEKKPLWEAGAGIAVLDFPDYRGSDERSNRIIPVPYFVYRGEFLRIERSSVRGRLFESDTFDLDMSLNGSIPVDSSDNKARAGMPDLDPTLELGPVLKIHLARNDTRKYTLDFRLPIRAVVTTELEHIGWVAHPHLNIDVMDTLGQQGWRLGMLAGPAFADQKYHDYFYSVDPSFATPLRPAFQARGGYAGSKLIVALSKRYPKFWFGSFIKLDTLSNARFENSPLVKDSTFFTAGFAITWILAESETMVEVERRDEAEN